MCGLRSFSMIRSMKSKAFLAALVLAPVFSLAAPTTSTATFSDSADRNLKLDGTGFAIIEASWTDPVAQLPHNMSQEFQAFSLIWTLYKGDSLKSTGSFSDVAGDSNSGQIVINESGLQKGEYKLVFTGKWALPTGKGEDEFDGSIEQRVSLGRVKYSSISPVPEPQTYAMLLVGLGVMGAIAIRRRKSDAT
jgi:hypothetical protein